MRQKYRAIQSARCIGYWHIQERHWYGWENIDLVMNEAQVKERLALLVNPQVIYPEFPSNGNEG